MVNQEATPAASQRQNESSRLPFLVLAIVLFVANLAFVWEGLDTSNSVKGNIYSGAVIGLFYGQIAAVAVLSTMSRANVVVRIVWGMLGVLFLAFALGVLSRKARWPVPLILSGSLFCQWLICQIPLWPMRWQGWIMAGGKLESQPGVKETQFGLRQIFFWTTAVAVLMGLVRFAEPLLQEGVIMDQQDWIIFLAFAIGNGLAVLPLIWASFVARGPWLWWVGAMVWAAAISIVESAVLSSDPTVTRNDTYIFYSINAAQFLTATAILYSIRWIGFRWHFQFRNG